MTRSLGRGRKWRGGRGDDGDNHVSRNVGMGRSWRMGFVACLVSFSLGLRITLSPSCLPTATNVAATASETRHRDHRESSEATDEAIRPGEFKMERLRATRKAATDLTRMLEGYYDGRDQAQRMLLGSWLSPIDFRAAQNDTAKRGFVDKLADTMARALVSEDQREFVIGVMGSSVAAGNGNCAYDNYPNQLERTLGPVWKAAGMTLAVQNTGAGECLDDHRNQVYCVKQNLSPFTDIVHYTWSLYENNEAEALNARESLVRWSQMLPHQPPVHVLTTGTLLAGDKNGKKHELAEHYANYSHNVFHIREGLVRGGYDYESAAKNGVDHFSPRHVGDGYHNITRYGEDEVDPDRRATLGVVMRNWHPGPLAFQLVSDAFAYVYASALLAALDLIEAEVRRGTDPRKVWSASTRPILLKSSLPEAKFCDPLYCVVDESPQCLNFEEPTFGWWGAKVEDDENLNPHRGERQNWTYVRRERENRIDKESLLFFRERPEVCEHAWECNSMQASGNDRGTLVLRLPKMEVGLVIICGYKRFKPFSGLENIDIKYNGQALDPATWDVFPNNKCLRLLRKFPTDSALTDAPTGHNYLAIGASSLNGIETIDLTHVITL